MRTPRSFLAAARLCACLLALVSSGVGYESAAAAPPAPTVATFVGQCTFGPVVSSPPLVATYSPTLTAIGGKGKCVSNVGVLEGVTISLSGAGALTCLGGEQSMSGNITWDGVLPPAATPVSATVVGTGPNLHLVLLGGGLVGDANLSWVSLGCPGSFSASLSGSMVFESG
jgi:hypothetical protein